jgi:diacylglycerol kinase
MGFKRMLLSFKSAWRGLCLCAERERSFQIQLIAAAWVLILLYTGGAEGWRFIAALLCIALVTSAEALNTAVEHICDRITTKDDPLIRDIKDIAAAAPLVCAAVSVIAAVILFWSKDLMLSIGAGMFEKGWCAVIIVVLPVAAILLQLPKRKGVPADGEKDREAAAAEAGKNEAENNEE